MARNECESASPECKYYFRPPIDGGNQDNGCYSDQDHLYGRGSTPLERRFCNLPENKRQICRLEHDVINADYVHLPVPDIETMEAAIQAEKERRRHV
jgi:hypothetical protein